MNEDKQTKLLELEKKFKNMYPSDIINFTMEFEDLAREELSSFLEAVNESDTDLAAGIIRILDSSVEAYLHIDKKYGSGSGYSEIYGDQADDCKIIIEDIIEEIIKVFHKLESKESLGSIIKAYAKVMIPVSERFSEDKEPLKLVTEFLPKLKGEMREEAIKQLQTLILEKEAIYENPWENFSDILYLLKYIELLGELQNKDTIEFLEDVRKKCDPKKEDHPWIMDKIDEAIVKIDFGETIEERVNKWHSELTNNEQNELSKKFENWQKNTEDSEEIPQWYWIYKEYRFQIHTKKN